MFKNTLIVILLALLAFMTWVAWYTSAPMKCDDIVWDKSNQERICEIEL